MRVIVAAGGGGGVEGGGRRNPSAPSHCCPPSLAMLSGPQDGEGSRWPEVDGVSTHLSPPPIVPRAKGDRRGLWSTAVWILPLHLPGGS